MASHWSPTRGERKPTQYGYSVCERSDSPFGAHLTFVYFQKSGVGFVAYIVGQSV